MNHLTLSNLSIGGVHSKIYGWDIFGLTLWHIDNPCFLRLLLSRNISSHDLMFFSNWGIRQIWRSSDYWIEWSGFPWDLRSNLQLTRLHNSDKVSIRLVSRWDKRLISHWLGLLQIYGSSPLGFSTLDFLYRKHVPCDPHWLFWMLHPGTPSRMV